jgi:hypothetical protein
MCLEEKKMNHNEKSSHDVEWSSARSDIHEFDGVANRQSKSRQLRQTYNLEIGSRYAIRVE